MEFRQMLDKLSKLIINIHTNDLISNRISLMEYTLVVIDYVNNNRIEESDLMIFRNLIKEVLRYGAEESVVESKNYKRKKYCLLTEKVKEEVNDNPIFVTQKEPITDLNSWIKSLRIFKISDRYNELEDNIYQSSYELYQAMRKIILKRSSTKCKRIYVGMIVEKLEREENLKILPANVKINEVDYELSQIIKLVKNNPGFGCEHTSKGISTCRIRNRLNQQTDILRVKMLMK